MARGIVVEKSGELEDLTIPQLKFTKGQIACLQNLLPELYTEEQISDVYCHQSSISSVEMLDLPYLRTVLKSDPNKMLKLWTILASRMIILHHSDLKQFSHFT